MNDIPAVTRGGVLRVSLLKRVTSSLGLLLVAAGLLLLAHFRLPSPLEAGWFLIAAAAFFAVGLAYLSPLGPYIVISEDGVRVRVQNDFFVEITFRWEDIDRFEIVHYCPIWRGLPYTRRFIGLRFTNSATSDRLTRLVNATYRQLTDMDYLLPDATTFYDGSIYGLMPEALIELLAAAKAASSRKRGVLESAPQSTPVA